jgi:ParB family chromosome partitioning protein
MKPKRKKQSIPDAKRLNAFSVPPEKLVIVTDESHPLYDERMHEPLEEETVLDIMKYGVLQDVICRKDGADFQVVFGRRRVLHAIEANKRFKASGSQTRVLIPVKVRRFANDAELYGVKISENMHRKDPDPVQQAREMQRGLSFGMSREDVRIAFKLNSLATLENRLKVLDLDKSVQKALQRGETTVTDVLPLAKLPRERQKTELDKKVKAKADRKVAKASGASPKKAPDKDHVRAIARWVHTKPDVRAALLWAIGDIIMVVAEVDIVGFGLAHQAVEKDEAAKQSGKNVAEPPLKVLKGAGKKAATKAEKAAAASTRPW